ncbi:MAG: chlorite dismutase family protein [candidate division WOR-3 bacterium]|jgi:chlorite dismutase
MERKLLIHYSLYKLKTKENIKPFFEEFSKFSQRTYFYITTPFRTEYDILVWNITSLENMENFINYFTKHIFKFRDLVEFKEVFWGFTKPSIYTRGQKSPQEIDPFDENRKKFFIVYPFVKTADWYILSFEERKEMMYEHIRIGKKYPEILQLLTYCFGLNDNEFIVAYETDNLLLFEELVEELRGSKARIYTKKDTPIITGIYIKREDLIDAF